MRWPWSRREPDKPPPDTKDYERLLRLEADMRQLRLEWSETYETVHAVLMKLSKRDKREAEKASQDAPGSTIAPPQGVTPPSADRWQQLAAVRKARASAG